MESKWHFFPGQTTETVKISDRAHALHIKSQLWNNITGHLDRKRLLQEAVDRERAHREALKEGSRAMTKNWANSVENMHQKKEQEMLEQLAQQKIDKKQLFDVLQKERTAIRQAYVDKVNKRLYVSGGYPKQLNAARFLSEVMYEREQQKAFNQKIRQHEEEEQQELRAYIDKCAKEDEMKTMEEKRADMEKRQAYGRELTEEVKKTQQLNDEKRKNRIMDELDERHGIEQDDEDMKKRQHENKLKRKRETQMEKRKNLDQELQRRRNYESEQEELRMAIETYAEAKSKIDCMRKMKELEIRETFILRRQQMAQQAAAVHKEKVQNAEEALQKVIADTEAKEQEKIRKKAEWAQQMKEIRILDRQEYMERQEKEKERLNDIKKWEMINRYKKEEALQQHENELRAIQWQKSLKYRTDLEEQKADDDERRNEEKRINDILSNISRVEEDKKFFAYAEELLDQARSKGRPTYPIESVIRRYKKDNSIP